MALDIKTLLWYRITHRLCVRTYETERDREGEVNGGGGGAGTGEGGGAGTERRQRLRDGLKETDRQKNRQ